MAKYTADQVDIALGIMSGRIDPAVELRFHGEAKKLHPDLKSAMDGGRGNLLPYEHRLKAEEILRHLIKHPEEMP